MLHRNQRAWLEDKSHQSKHAAYRVRWNMNCRELSTPTIQRTREVWYSGAAVVRRPAADRENILNRWYEHFKDVLNRLSIFDDSVIDEVPKLPLKLELAEPPTIKEVDKVISLLANYKAPGLDTILAEVFKCGGAVLTARLFRLFETIFRTEMVPQDFKDAYIVHLYKRKGDRATRRLHDGMRHLFFRCSWQCCTLRSKD